MQDQKRIRVLVVDDSILFRELLSRGLALDPAIEIAGTAKDAFEAGKKLASCKPDVMTCDVEMPGMNGIEFIRKILPIHPLPVIVVSSLSNSVFDAMNAGAVDFVGKPDVKKKDSVERFLNEMATKIKIASCARVLQTKGRTGLRSVIGEADADSDKIIAIGASTGGTEAIFNILRSLPQNVPGIVVVQHIPAGFSKMFAERIHSSTVLTVKEAQSGDIIEKGRVFIAPGNYHMKIKKAGSFYKVDCYEGEKVNGHRPSVDVLFESVAKEAGGNSIGIILTGMGYDGAKGLLSMRRKGARTIGQDEKTSVVYGMPRVAYELGAVERQSPLNDIPQLLYSMLIKK